MSNNVLTTKELDELYQKYSNNELDLDETTKQLTEIFIRVLKSEGVSEKERKELIKYKSSQEEFIKYCEDATKDEKIGIPKADEKLREARYRLRNNIDSTF